MLSKFSWPIGGDVLGGEIVRLPPTRLWSGCCHVVMTPRRSIPGDLGLDLALPRPKVAAVVIVPVGVGAAAAPGASRCHELVWRCSGRTP